MQESFKNLAETMQKQCRNRSKIKKKPAENKQQPYKNNQKRSGTMQKQ